MLDSAMPVWYYCFILLLGEGPTSLCARSLDLDWDQRYGYHPCIGYDQLLSRWNARRDQRYKAPEQHTVEERYVERTNGDPATSFKYTI